MNTATDAPERTLANTEPRTASLPATQRQALPAAVATTQDASSFLQIIATASRDTSVDVDKMDRLYAMYERVKDRAAEEAFNAAMNAAQREMGRVSADAVNPQTRSQYATFGKLDGAVRPIYTKHGFSISFNEGEGAPEGYARILAYVSHSAGHTRTYKMDMPADGKGAKGGDVMTKTHATGSAHSYGRRYLLKDIFNIAIGEEDNDGNGAGDDGGGEGEQRAYTPEQKLEQTLLDSGRAAAMEGMQSLTKWWGKLGPREQKLMNPHFGAMRKAARAADEGGGRGNS